MTRNPSLVITADARIDNRKELAEELNIVDEEDVSDSYFILKSYEKWEDKCPEYLLGDFSFAIWDKNKGKLFCARDHMGVKPFYYYSDEKVFAFGTEIKSILSVPNLHFKLDEKRLANFLMVTDFFDKENTFYENIKSLTAACSLIIDKNEIKSSRYWKLNPECEIIMDSDEDYANAFREIFTEAVRCRLRSNSSPGVMLSGGLDYLLWPAWQIKFTMKVNFMIKYIVFLISLIITPILMKEIILTKFLMEES